MTEFESWQSHLEAYTIEYAPLDEKLLSESKQAIKAMRGQNKAVLSSASVELSTVLQRLVELRADAAYNYREIENLYKRTIIIKKLEKMRSGEKKIAAGVAEDEAVRDSSQEFDILNEAKRHHEFIENRTEATLSLLESLRFKLQYG